MPSIFSLIPGVDQKGVRFCIPRVDPDNPDKTLCIDLIDIDATLSENHRSIVEPTDSAIEDGSVISDHLDIQPKEITIEAVVSNNPLSITQAVIGNAAGLVGSVIGRGSQSNISGAIASGSLAAYGNAIARTVVNEGNRAKMAMEKLQAAQESGVTLSIKTRLKNYTNMILRDFTATRDASTGNVLQFTAVLREIRLVTSQTIQTPKEAIERIRQNSATPKSNQGRQQSPEASEATQEGVLGRILNQGDKESLLYSLRVGLLGGN